MSGTAAGYRYLRVLGAGGFGEVHLARHEATGRHVAIKHIHRHLLTDPDVLERFRREARVLAATSAPGVVQVYDLDTSGDPARLVMEYVPGVTLWDLMEVAPLPPRQAIAALADVAQALRVMAERGLVHRDVKPSNVFVLPGGRAKLGDFGLARLTAPGEGFRTVGAPAGTPAYFPPEVSSGAAEASPASDAYSFAVMAYEVLTGTRPITAPDAISIITAHWTQPPRPATDALPGFPPAAAEVLMAALAKEPDDRPLPTEVVAALQAVPAGGWPTDDRPEVPVPEAPPLDTSSHGATGGAPETVVVTPGARDGAPVVPTRVRPTGRGRRTTVLGWGAAGVALAVLAAVAALLLTGRLSDGEAPATDLVVESVDLTGEPAVVRCPEGTVRLVADVATNGSPGRVAVAWTLPDGSTGPVQTFDTSAGQRQVQAVLTATLSGANPVQGDAVARVSPSGLEARTAVQYRCDRG